MTHISESAWLNVYGTCRECGCFVSHYAITPRLLVERPCIKTGAFDYWAACDNPQCKHHDGEGIKQNAKLAWEDRRNKR